MEHITIFDKPYNVDKIAEGKAVTQAMLNGDCNRCGYYLKCSSDSDFEFPENAPCMHRSRRIEGGIR